MRTLQQEKAENMKQKAISKQLAEDTKSAEFHKMQMHEISKAHAEAILENGSNTVYGFASHGFEVLISISELEYFKTYFIK
jgi:hypothetical protein